MSVAKNKLQDIYDAGSSKLDELDRSQRDNFKETSDIHGSKVTTIQSTANDQLQQRLSEVRSDINSSVERSIQKLQKVIDHDKQEIERHLKELHSGVTSLAQKLTEAINEIRQAHEAKLDILREDMTDLYEREFKNSSADLQKLDFTCSKNLRVQNTFVMSSFQQKLDHGLLETRGEEKQVNNRLIKLYLQNTNSIDSTVSSLGQSLSEDFDQRSEDLESRFQAGVTGLEGQTEQLGEDADKHITNGTQKIHETYERESFALKSEFEKSGSQCLSEMQTLHESTLRDLSKTFDNFFKELEDGAESTRQLLKVKSDSLRSKVSSGVESVVGECHKRKDLSTGLRREIDNTAKEILDKIKKDLSSTQKDFEERLSQAATSAVQELDLICSKTESHVNSAKESSEGELRSMADKSKAQIQVTLSALLERVTAHRNAALEEVHVAAGAGPPAAETKQPEAPKKKKTSTRERPAVTDKDTSSPDENSTGETPSLSEPVEGNEK